MAHRTLNPKTAFGYDARENAQYKPTPKRPKREVDAAWAQEFPGVPRPTGYGCLPWQIYPKLEEAGWKFSGKYGWRKPQAVRT